MRNRRLLCVYQHAPTPGAPGIYRHRLYFAELVRRGWAVDLVSTPINYMTGEVPPPYRRRPFRDESIDGIAHHWVWASGSIHRSKRRRASNYLTFASAAAARALLLPRPDVVMVSSPPLTVGTVGPVLARRFRVPWILEVRDVWPESAASVGWLDEGGRAYRAVERVAHRLARTADEVIVPTPGLVADLERHGARHVHVLPGPVLDAGATAEERRAARLELGLADGTCAVVYAGAIGVANGLDLLLDAVRDLPPAADTTVLVAGDGSARAAVEQRLSSEAIARVRMLGPIPKDDVRRLLAAADVCLHLLRPDPLFATAQPTKMLEYFGAHRAVITTVPGLPEQLATASGGGFAPSAAALTDELARWTALAPEERLRRGDAAFAFGSARFGLEANVDAFEQLLDGVSRRGGARRRGGAD